MRDVVALVSGLVVTGLGLLLLLDQTGVVHLSLAYAGPAVLWSTWRQDFAVAPGFCGMCRCASARD